LRQIPVIIADNGGYDSADLIQEIKVKILDGEVNTGLNMWEGKPDDMSKLGV
jgi:T-complex protein 1 subunit beta